MGKWYVKKEKTSHHF